MYAQQPDTHAAVKAGGFSSYLMILANLIEMDCARECRTGTLLSTELSFQYTTLRMSSQSMHNFSSESHVAWDCNNYF